jgi:hypothetical protein
MLTVAKVTTALQTVVTTTAEQAARQSGCVRRVRKFTGATWVQTLVFGFLAHPAATLDQLCQLAAVRGVTVSPQGLAARFTEAAALCLRQVLEAAVGQTLATDPAALPLLDRFAAVGVADSTLIRLPDALAGVWAGHGGGPATGDGTGTRSALKLQVGLDLRSGRLSGPTLHPGRQHDQREAIDPATWGPDALVLRDLGYFNLDTLAAQQAAGQWWVSRPKINVTVRAADRDTPTTIAALLAPHADATTAGTVHDMPIQLGTTHRLACRLVAVRVPATVAASHRRKAREEGRKHGRIPSAARLATADWFVVVTNLPPARATADEVLVLARVRWQIELVFRRWKSVGQVAESRSAQPWRILCEVYAKLIGLVLAHWVTLLGAWVAPNRSLWQALTVAQTHAPDLARTLDDPLALDAALHTLATVQRATCRLTTRKTRPATWQWLTPEEAA